MLQLFFGLFFNKSLFCFVFSADVRNGVNDSEESIQSIECIQIQNNRQNECQDIVLIETNRTESSLQSKQTDQTIGGTESESQIDLKEVIVVDSRLNQKTSITDHNIIDDKRDDISEDKVDESPLIAILSEECVNESESKQFIFKPYIDMSLVIDLDTIFQ